MERSSAPAPAAPPQAAHESGLADASATPEPVDILAPLRLLHGGQQALGVLKTSATVQRPVSEEIAEERIRADIGRMSANATSTSEAKQERLEAEKGEVEERQEGVPNGTVECGEEPPAEER